MKKENKLRGYQFIILIAMMAIGFSIGNFFGNLAYPTKTLSKTDFEQILLQKDGNFGSAEKLENWAKQFEGITYEILEDGSVNFFSGDKITQHGETREWALAIAGVAWMVGAVGLGLLPLFFLGIIGLVFRGTSNPILYVFAILFPPIVALTSIPYTVKTPLGAIFSAFIGNFACFLPIWGNFRAWTILSRNQRRKEREELGEIIAEAIAKNK